MRVRHIIQCIVTVISIGGCGDDKRTGTSSPEAEVTYVVTFEATWSATTHPDSFPLSPHFSTLVGATHNASVSFWTPGSLATAGIKDVAERGSTFLLLQEIAMAIDSSSAQFSLTGGSISTSPGNVSLSFDITPECPLVTLVSMLAPSPDWFVGVSGLSLLQSNQWIDSLSIELFLYDAGTDSGPSYASPNDATIPADNISLISGFPTLVDGSMRSVGAFTFKKQ